MKRKKKQTEGHTLRLAITFFVLVGLLLLGSILVKLATVIEKSHFDGTHRFTVEFTTKDKSFAKVVSFAPDTRSISIVTISNGQAVPHIGKFLGVPIDAKVKNSKETRLAARQEDVVLELQSLLFTYGSVETTLTPIQSGLTPIDILRLFLFAKEVPNSSVATREISSSLDGASIDKISSNLFVDYTLSQENISIQIINATQVSGLGNRLTRLITNMGGNVVSVVSKDESIKQSTISYTTKKTYTLQRLEKVLGFQSKILEEKGIADIILTIGEDGVLTLF